MHLVGHFSLEISLILCTGKVKMYQLTHQICMEVEILLTTNTRETLTTHFTLRLKIS